MASVPDPVSNDNVTPSTVTGDQQSLLPLPPVESTDKPLTVRCSLCCQLVCKDVVEVVKGLCQLVVLSVLAGGALVGIWAIGYGLTELIRYQWNPELDTFWFNEFWIGLGVLIGFLIIATCIRVIGDRIVSYWNQASANEIKESTTATTVNQKESVPSLVALSAPPPTAPSAAAVESTDSTRDEQSA